MYKTKTNERKSIALWLLAILLPLIILYGYYLWSESQFEGDLFDIIFLFVIIPSVLLIISIVHRANSESIKEYFERCIKYCFILIASVLLFVNILSYYRSPSESLISLHFLQMNARIFLIVVIESFILFWFIQFLFWIASFKRHLQQKNKEGRIKNPEETGFVENFLLFFRNPKEYCNTFSNHNNKIRVIWIVIIYLIYIAVSFLTHSYIFYYFDSPSKLYIIFYPVGVAFVFVILILILFKFLKLNAKFTEISIVYFIIIALALILSQIVVGILITVLVFISFTYYLTIYILSRNKKNVPEVVLFFIILFVIGGLLQFFIFNKFLIAMQESFEYDKRHAEYGANWDFIAGFDEATSIQDLQKGISFCTKDWKENSLLDALECYEYIYPLYYKYDPGWVESICLDETNIHPSNRNRNENQLKCLQLVARQKIINKYPDGIDFCENSKFDDQICLCKAGVLFELFENDLLSQEEFYDGLKKAHNSSIFGCDNEINELNRDKNFELPEFKFATVNFKIVPI